MRLAELLRVGAGRLRARWLALRGAQVGAKVFVGRRVRVDEPRKVEIGERATIDDDVRMVLPGEGARVRVGAHAFVGSRTQFDIHDVLEIGEHALFGPGCFVTDHDHGLSRDRRIDEQECRFERVRIGRDAWLGAHAVVLAGVDVGDGAVVGAGAVVTKSVPPGVIAVGVPARAVGERA